MQKKKIVKINFLILIDFINLITNKIFKIQFFHLKIESPPLQKRKLASHQFKKFMIILEYIGNITIYLAIIYFVFDLSIEKILYIAYSFIPLACFYLITAFVPEISRQDLSKVFPELLN